MSIGGQVLDPIIASFILWLVFCMNIPQGWEICKFFCRKLVRAEADDSGGGDEGLQISLQNDDGEAHRFCPTGMTKMIKQQQFVFFGGTIYLMAQNQ